MKYITKQDALNKGLIKKDGKIYKLSVLEIWFKKGYLDLDKSKYSADERLEYGLRLVFDYHIINRAYHSLFAYKKKKKKGKRR